MQLSVFGRVLLDSRRAVVVALLLGALMGLAYSLRQQPIYTTTARVIVVADPDQRPFADLAALFLSQRRARDFLTLLTSPALLQRAVVVYGLPTTAEDLRNNLTITSPRDTALIDITATAPTGELATKYVVTVAQEFVTAASELEKQGAVHVRVVDPAAVPPYRSRPRTAKNIVDAALALALVALVASFYRARRNPKLGYLPDLRTIGDVPVIGMIEVGGRTHLAGRRSRHRQTAQLSQGVDRIAERLVAAGASISLAPPEHQAAHPATPRPELRYLRACFGDAEGWLIVAASRKPHNSSGNGRHSRWEMLTSDLLALRITESRLAARRAMSLAAVGTATRPMHVGIISTDSRWDELRRFADQLNDNGRLAVMVIVDSKVIERTSADGDSVERARIG
ncbi:hypothetical protein [Mycobacterium sp. UM_Kg1]|uniref:YveK family protein n=1 Tax=Mycobacterium sp. UM_Kg1 TaxID=1545691 RepID=UPI00061B2F7F|nr:hypothetical protein [Mycobacterium sp. UM_Kg1]